MATQTEQSTHLATLVTYTMVGRMPWLWFGDHHRDEPGDEWRELIHVHIPEGYSVAPSSGGMLELWYGQEHCEVHVQEDRSGKITLMAIGAGRMTPLRYTSTK